MASEEAEIKELSKKLAQNPDSMVFVQLADAYRRAKDLESSVRVCLEGLERHPTYTTARAILGRNFLDLGRLDEAEAEFRKIEVADPENIMAHRMLGQIFMQKGQYAEAINRQQRVLSLDPEDGTAQELLQEALLKSKETQAAPASKTAPPSASPGQVPASAKASGGDQSGTIKVAEIYIKKGAFDEAVEVLQEILASDPDNAVARQKLQEVNEKRGGGKAEAEAKKKAEEEAKLKAEADAKKKAEDDARAKAEAEAKKKAEEEAKKKAEADAKAKAEADAKKKAEDEAKAKAEAEARKKAEDEAKKKAEDEAKAKAEADAKKKAEDEAKKKAEEEAKAKAEAEAAEKKKAEEAARKREEEEKERKASKLSSDDILSVMASSSDDLIDEPAAAPKGSPSAGSGQASAPQSKAAPPAAGSGQASGADAFPAAARTAVEDFLRAQSMEASMLMDSKGALLESKVSGDAVALGAAAGAIFSNTEKAAQRMSFGGLKQIMIVGEDGRQILFVALKAGVLVALTGRNTNLGLLRVAVNDLVKKA